MAKFYDRLEQKHVDFIARQKIFFVATAPLSGVGRVNLSPKGYDSLRVVDETHIEWIDLGGSGIETQAHLQENGRITLMFCAFEGAANIMRVYGRGEAIDFGDPRFDEAKAAFPQFEKARAIIRVAVDEVQDSCGWGVPFFDFRSERDQLKRSVDHRSEEEFIAHRRKTNATSIDGLPGLAPAGDAKH